MTRILLPIFKNLTERHIFFFKFLILTNPTYKIHILIYIPYYTINSGPYNQLHRNNAESLINKILSKLCHRVPYAGSWIQGFVYEYNKHSIKLI